MNNADKQYGQCARCGLANNARVCRNPESGKGPEFCSTLLYPDVIEDAKKAYKEDGIYRFTQEAARQEGSAYGRDARSGLTTPVKSRIQETIDFCDRMGYKRIGLAFCGGLHREAAIVAKIFTAHGLDVVSVMCKVGGIDKCDFLELKPEETVSGGHESMCNPATQAMILNKERTELNVLLGLCVGHDSLFIKYSDAMCTVLAVKDRLTGHNPLAPIYTTHSYCAYLTAEPMDEKEKQK